MSPTFYCALTEIMLEHSNYIQPDARVRTVRAIHCLLGIMRFCHNRPTMCDIILLGLENKTMAPTTSA